jgi:hypothetical protein
MTDDQVHSAVVRWLAKVTGRAVIKAHQSEKAPALPYLMVNMLNVTEVRVHAHDVEYVEASTGDMSTGDEFPPVTATPVIESEWHFSTHAYGPNPTSLLRPVASAAHITQAMEPLFPTLVIHDVSVIRHVPDFINNTWEPRAQMDIYVRGLTRDGHDFLIVEEAPVTVEPTA